MINAFPAIREGSRCHGSRLWATVLSLTLGLGGCSISMPIPGLIDDEPLGSIQTKAHASANPVDAADWPLASPALGAAIKASEDAEPSLWSNPKSRASGAFLAVGPAFTRDGAKCRAVIARIGSGESAARWRGLGCRRADDSIAFENAEHYSEL